MPSNLEGSRFKLSTKLDINVTFKILSWSVKRVIKGKAIERDEISAIPAKKTLSKESPNCFRLLFGKNLLNSQSNSKDVSEEISFFL